ncbi:2,3-bisphosphoglycerate-dependent phosphoglycerate mutase [Pelagibius litoralis]|uniref:2,3-bisphosphoglycerate-dependent phosphoglycerate mutase n=1 Tax=Pelagibius litoralis TaxID=374515 RepID=A0A967KA88_9PROT|nr:2,3-bisphosphoglycerate-dependent phosphoglycerate mutase [Pelagibius litoralis]NIA71503.1 2,3-bisphosphoglycerate-dependent phosphoglycerate mutase [Pelagibius litoralis]
MPTLVLVRHGKTEWSSQNRFAGWADAPLSMAGRREAQAAGRLVAAMGLRFDLCATSYLERASETLELVLQIINQPSISTVHTWRLNERHYGALQGENRAKMALRYGNQQVARWRRSFDAEPPPLGDNDPRLPCKDPLYAGIDSHLLPRSESLQQASARVAPWWHDTLAPRLSDGQNALVTAHTSSIRGLARQIEGLDDATAAAFRIATATPLVYRLDDSLKVLEKRELTAGWRGRLRQLLNRHKPGKGISWI